MPQFDFTGRTPQTQVQGSGPRDQGTSVRIQSQLQAAQGLQQAVGALDQYGRDRVQEQAKSDMSAFQARRISLEGDYKRNSLNAKNPEDLKKLTDKYIKDLNNYADGKREDGTPVFRNGMGKAGYKQFSQGYQAQVKEQAAQQAFEMDRKRDRLNYQISINSGIKNNNPEAINQSYAELVEAGHITSEEATIEKEKAMTEMSLTYFKEQNAKMMIGVEEALATTDNLKQTGSQIKSAVENYKSELYSDKNLNDQQRLQLLNNAKASLKAVEYKHRQQKDQQDLQMKQNGYMAEVEWQNAILAGADPEEASVAALDKWGTRVEPTQRTKFFDRAMKHRTANEKAFKDQKQAGVNKANDLSAMYRIRNYDPANDPTGERWKDLNTDMAFMFNGTLQGQAKELLKQLNPTDPNSQTPFGEFSRKSNKLISDLMGIGLTQTERKALDSDRISTPESLEGSPEEFFDYLSESERLGFLNDIMKEAQERYMKDPSDAKQFIMETKDKLHKENNDRIFYDQYYKVTPEQMIRRKR